MKYSIIHILIPSIQWGQEFRLDTNSIPVQFEQTWDLISPWCGGINDSDPHPIDIDDDGDWDLMVAGFFRNLCFFENVATPEEPDFVFRTRSMVGVQNGVGCFTVSFGDLDNDGDYDFIAGRDSNVDYLMYYKNIGSANNPQFILENDSLLYIQDVFNFNPALVDIDNDSDLDLFIDGGFIIRQT
jgi:hypothetical protein